MVSVVLTLKMASRCPSPIAQHGVVAHVITLAVKSFCPLDLK